MTLKKHEKEYLSTQTKYEIGGMIKNVYKLKIQNLHGPQL